MKKRLIIGLFICFCLIIAMPAIGADPSQNLYGLNTTAQQSGLIKSNSTPYTISEIVGIVINALLSLLGVIYLLFLIVSGIQWMTAGGNEETVTKAKKRLINATIGLAIIFAAFIITNYVVFTLVCNMSPNSCPLPQLTPPQTPPIQFP